MRIRGPVQKLQGHYQPEVSQIVFDISAERIIFATIDGKSPCDGICGSVKRHAAKCSLQQPLDNQMLDYEGILLKLCKDMSDIKFFDMSEDTMEGARIYVHTDDFDVPTIIEVADITAVTQRRGRGAVSFEHLRWKVVDILSISIFGIICSLVLCRFVQCCCLTVV